MTRSIRTFSFLVLSFLLAVVPAWALDTKQKQIVAMEAMLAELDTHYGLGRAKYRDFGITVESLRVKYTDLINKAQTLEESLGHVHPTAREILPPNEFRQLMIGMVADLRDGHTNTGRQLSEVYGVGFYTANVGGRLYVSEINKDLLQRRTGAKEIRENDEILAVNGVPVDKIAEQRMMYSQRATYESRYTEAMESILMPYTSIFRSVKEGDEVRITFKRGSDEFDVYLNWLNLSEYLIVRNRYSKHFDLTRWKGSKEEAPTPYNWSGQVLSNFKRGLNKMGASVVNIGELLNAELEKKAKDNPGKPELVPVTRLQAYVVRHNGKNVGVLRVPSYTSPEIMNEIKWAREALERLDGFSDVVVLDVSDNSGGSVYFGTRLVSLLAGEEALQSMRSDYRITETLVANNKPSGRSKDSENNEFANYGEERLNDLEFEMLKKQYEAGEKWTGWLPTFGNVRNRSGHGVVVPDSKFTLKKPLLIYNTKRSASGGDFVPAILQSAKRAMIMGETSQGLGAPVYREIESMPGSEMSFRCPMAECERLDGIPIENIGPVADLPRPLAIEDVKAGFETLATDVLDTAVALAEGKSKAEMQKVLKDRARSRVSREITESKLEPVQKILKEFAESEIFKKAESDLSNSLLELSAAYTVLGQQLAEAGKDLNRTEWQQLMVPMPKTFVLQDHIMSSLWQKDGMIERLEQLPNVPKWKSDFAGLALAKSIANALRAVPGDIRVADDCNLLLLAASGSIPKN